jgi:tetratricopeptide (TPR) repeat protein
MRSLSVAAKTTLPRFLSRSQLGLVYTNTAATLRALEASEEAVGLATSSGFPLTNAIGKICRARARAQIGEIVGAVGQIQERLAEFDAPKFYLSRASFLIVLCETQALAGEVDDALVTIEQALRTNPDDLVYRPEVLRLRGELRLRTGASSRAPFELGERDFREAIGLAHGMSAKSLELRATMSLAWLLAKQGDRDEARALLAEIYGWFTEGFDTADLKDAKALLETLHRPT